MNAADAKDELNATEEEEEKEEVNYKSCDLQGDRRQQLGSDSTCGGVWAEKEVFLLDTGSRFTSTYGKRALPAEGAVTAVYHFERNPEGRLIDYWPVKEKLQSYRLQCLWFKPDIS